MCNRIHIALDLFGLDLASQFTTEDVSRIKFARNLFHSCSVIPALLYYGDVDACCISQLSNLQGNMAVIPNLNFLRLFPTLFEIHCRSMFTIFCGV
jgi:hypothetical protein